MEHTPRSQQPDQSHSGAHPAPHHFPRPANEPYLESALEAAKIRSVRAAVRFGLSRADREDLQQAVLVDLLERASQFDPSKGSAGTFTGLVSAHRSARFLKDLKKDRCRLRFCTGDEANEDETARQGALVDAAVPLWGEATNGFDEIHALRDLDYAIQFMDEEQRTLLSLLVGQDDLPAACQIDGRSRATFYRRVAELRMHLRMFGLHAAA